MAGEDPTKNDPAQNPDPEPEPEPSPALEPDDGVKDSHGQPGINKERHDREVAELKATIADLQKQVADAAETKEGRDSLQRQLDELTSKMADSETTHALEMAGCVNAKAAKALLDDYDGDVAKMKEACPYLFGTTKQTGSTGAKPGGAPDKSEERRANARKAAAGNLTIKR